MPLTIRDVASMLHDSFDSAPASQHSVDVGVEMVSSLARQDVLPDLLHSVRSDEDAAANYARLSYRHPLGFDKLVLVDAEPTFMLRLHVWWPGDARGVEHVHNHRFGLASSVVVGGYDMELYRLASVGVPVIEYREQLRPGTLDWQLAPRTTRHLTRMARMRVGMGSAYGLGANALHRVSVPDGALCVTLFLETLIVRSTTRVFAEPDHAAPPLAQKLAFDSANYLQRIDSVLNVLPG